MSETLSEVEGCDLLARLFRSRGYSIVRNFDFHEYGVSFHADGWDAKARVGFEFLTSEDDDHDDLSLEEYKSLMAAQQRGELALFIIDEVEPLSAVELAASANEFLDEVAEAVKSRSLRPRAKASAGGGAKPRRKVARRSGGMAVTKLSSKTRVARKKLVKKKTVKKKAAGKRAAAKKAVKKKAVRRSRRSGG